MGDEMPQKDYETRIDDAVKIIHAIRTKLTWWQRHKDFVFGMAVGSIVTYIALLAAVIISHAG